MYSYNSSFMNPFELLSRMHSHAIANTCIYYVYAVCLYVSYHAYTAMHIYLLLEFSIVKKCVLLLLLLLVVVAILIILSV